MYMCYMHTDARACTRDLSSVGCCEFSTKIYRSDPMFASSVRRLHMSCVCARVCLHLCFVCFVCCVCTYVSACASVCVVVYVCVCVFLEADVSEF